MRATCFLLAATTALCACLDFDVFDTEPTTGSTSSTGGAGGAGGDGGAGTTTATTTTGMGGQGGAGGAGGGVVAPPPCGNVSDDFDGGPGLNWMTTMGTQYANDRAVAGPPNGVFSYVDDPVALADCSIQIDVVVDTDQSWFFGWGGLGNPNDLLWFAVNPIGEARVILNDGGFVGTLVGTGETTARVRISNSDGQFRVETAAVGTEDWMVRYTLDEAEAPAWLGMPGYPQFGVQGQGSGTSAEFDDFNIP